MTKEKIVEAITRIHLQPMNEGFDPPDYYSQFIFLDKSLKEKYASMSEDELDTVATHLAWSLNKCMRQIDEEMREGLGEEK